MPTLQMCIGLPGSGKSTWCADYINRHPEAVSVSTDAILEEWARERNTTYNLIFQTYFPAAQDLFFHRFEEAVSFGKNIIVDRTNLTIVSRSRFMFVRSQKYTVHAIVFNTPLYLIMDRLNRRTDKNIPLFVLENMKSIMQLPSLEEFDSITTVNHGIFS